MKLDECVAQPVQLFASVTDLTEEDKLLVARTQSSVLLEHLLSEWTTLDGVKPEDTFGTAPKRVSLKRVDSEARTSTPCEKSDRHPDPTGLQNENSPQALPSRDVGLLSLSSTAGALLNAIAENRRSSIRPDESIPPLPDGWVHHVDTDSRKSYYVHLPTKRIEFKHPSSPPGPMTAKEYLDNQRANMPVLSIPEGWSILLNGRPEPAFWQLTTGRVQFEFPPPTNEPHDDQISTSNRHHRSRSSRKSEKPEKQRDPPFRDQYSPIIVGGKEWVRDEEDPDKFVRHLTLRETWKEFREARNTREFFEAQIPGLGYRHAREEG